MIHPFLISLLTAAVGGPFPALRGAFGSLESSSPSRARNGHDHASDRGDGPHPDEGAPRRFDSYHWHHEQRLPTEACELNNLEDLMSLEQSLQAAAFRGHESEVRSLLEWGADIHAEDDGALRLAASGGYESVVCLLLDHGADVHVLCDYALKRAALGGHESTVRLLLDRGADIHAQDDWALRWAADGGHESTVRLLLERGADGIILQEDM